MADIKISGLTNADPLRDGMIFPVSYHIDKNGTELNKWQSGRISSESIANYVADGVLSHIKNIEGGITIKKEESSGLWIIHHDVDTELYKIVASLPENGEENKIYLVPNVNSEDESTYIEWHYTDGNWVEFGKHRADTSLEDYYKAAEVDQKIKALKDGQVTTNANDIANLQGTVSGHTTQLTNAETEITNLKGDHVTRTEYTSLKNAQEADATAITDIVNEIGEPAGEVTEATGIYGTIKAVEDAYKAADSGLDTRLKAAEETLKGVATDTGLAQLTTKVDTNTTSISTLNTAIAGKVSNDDFDNYKTSITTKFGEYVKDDVYQTHISNVESTLATKTLVTEGLALKADQSDFDTLEGRVGTLEGKPHYTQVQIEAFTGEYLTANEYATKTDVSNAVDAVDVTEQLKDYLTIDNAASTYETKANVTAITTPNTGTIDTRIKAAKDDLQGQLDAAKTRIATLESQMEKLLAKISQYDTRFGWTEDTDGTFTGWSKSFLIVDDGTAPVLTE